MTFVRLRTDRFWTVDEKAPSWTASGSGIIMAAMPRDLPTGVVTLLFTDVEGSTKLLREIGDGYAEALHEHRRVLRSAVAAHHGVEVDTQGDAFFVAFARASDAVGAVVDAQRGLAGGPIRVRMGLHTGEPRLTEEGYVGLDVHKGARIAAVGHGGQVLLSQATRALVEVDARDLGPHRLKDLSAPERIYQLEIDGLPSEFPPLKTMDAGSTNLPASRTSFVARAEELEAIDRLLEDPGCRLLTLVGPGGVGKTRLALEAAGRRLDRYQHGVHFVPLASVASPDFLAPAMADSLQFPVDTAHSGFSAQDQLLDFLSERSTLLVLDNFEHLVEGSELLSQVIERAPRVEMLATEPGTVTRSARVERGRRAPGHRGKHDPRRQDPPVLAQPSRPSPRVPNGRSAESRRPRGPAASRRLRSRQGGCRNGGPR
jgi:class 3 adenylate cyclase